MPAHPDQALPAVLAQHPRALLDATERPMPRSTDTETQRSITPKKRHTVKNNLLCSPNKRVLFLSATYPGTVHDKALCDEGAYAFPQGIVLNQDAGYQSQRPAGAAT